MRRIRDRTWNPRARASDRLRFNVVFSQHVRLQDYLRERLAAVSKGQAVIAKAAMPRG